MKRIMKLVTLLLCIIMSITTLCACSFFFNSPNDDGEGDDTSKSFTVQYYDNKTIDYTVTGSEKSIKTDFIAPSGQVIKGLFDDNDIQYADYDCIVDLKNRTLPSVLYAKYEDVDISYLNDDPFTAWDENPKQIGFYTGSTLTWKFDPAGYPDDQKMLSACLCNPYADLTITVSFMGKGNTDRGNEFYSKLIVCDETVDQINYENLGNNYTKYSYSATIKAKQLTNGNYEVKVKTSAKYGYEDYTIKNYRIDFSFNFNNN